jgi:hypothetical protein
VAAAVAAAIAVCAAVSAPSLASAAVTIGGDVTASRSPISCGGDATHPAACDIAQTALVGGRNAAPFDGVVVRWRVGGAGPVALRVVRPKAFTYTFVSTSAVQTPASTGVETFATRQPIAAGDEVGVELGPGSQIGAVDPAPADDTKATLRLSRKDATLVRRALAKREKLKAIVALSVKDAAGNQSATKLSLKLRR